jgi:hypothetical protein
MIRVAQLRAIQRAAHFKPQGRRRVFILDGADTMRYTDADVFLKILEEPPESATMILIATSPDSLLPTIRSRCLQFHFAPVPGEKVEEFLSKRTELKPLRPPARRSTLLRLPGNRSRVRSGRIGTIAPRSFATHRTGLQRRQLPRNFRRHRAARQAGEGIV